MRQPRKPSWRCPAGPHAAKRGVAPPSAPAPSMLKMWPPAGCSRITRIACRRLRARASGCRPPLLYNGGDPAAGGHGWRQQIPATRSARHEALAVGISAARGSLGGAQDRTRTATCAAQPARPGRHAGAHEGAALESPGPPPPPPPRGPAAAGAAPGHARLLAAEHDAKHVGLHDVHQVRVARLSEQPILVRVRARVVDPG